MAAHGKFELALPAGRRLIDVATVAVVTKSGWIELVASSRLSLAAIIGGACRMRMRPVRLHFSASIRVFAASSAAAQHLESKRPMRDLNSTTHAASRSVRVGSRALVRAACEDSHR
jgi:hypothetical protein